MRILDEAVVDAVRLSHRYISGRQLPDKSVSLLDTACARVAIGHSATPPAVEDCRRRIGQRRPWKSRSSRARAWRDGDHAARLAELTAEPRRRPRPNWRPWKPAGRKRPTVHEIRKIRSNWLEAAQPPLPAEGRLAGSPAAAAGRGSILG